MVVYTATTRAAAGGTDAMLATIYLALSEANQSYLNSNISQRLRLVHTEEVNYAESGNIQTDRDRLQNPSDGIMDNVPTLRNTYAADVVALIQEDGGGYCGISFIMSPVSNAFEPFGYAVVARSCATGNYSFAHELGHVMGARHDWYVDSTNNSAYAFNHGYVNKTPTAPAAPWRTIMAYNNDCSDGGINCTRVPYWSNPNVNYPVGGDPMGVASGGQQSDNHQVLNNTALTVANFRCSSPIANNVWMKDTWDDTGAEPDPHTVGEDMWKSPYIWVRNSQDTTLVHQHQHQDPIFGQTNWIYTKLHNGSGDTSGNLEIYWADGSTALSWPADWHLLHSTPVNFAGHSTTIVETQWIGLPGTGHFCLLARWNSPSDPMAFPEAANLEQNVRQNNNLVWRNLDIVDMGHDTAADETFIVRNVNREARGIYSLIVRSPKNEVGNSFIRYGRVTVQFDELLMKAWQEGGSRGTGFKMDGLLAVVVDPNGAVFENLIMAPNGAGHMRLNFKKSPSTPKRTYILDTVQLGQGKNPVIGGMSFEIHTDQLPK